MSNTFRDYMKYTNVFLYFVSNFKDILLIFTFSLSSTNGSVPVITPPVPSAEVYFELQNLVQLYNTVYIHISENIETYVNKTIYVILFFHVCSGLLVVVKVERTVSWGKQKL